MALITKHSKEDRNVITDFIGVRVPNEIGSFLTLYSLAEGITKSKIILNLLVEWKQGRQREVTVEELYDKIAKRSLESWRHRKQRSVTFYSYCNLLRIELKNRGVNETLVNKLIKMLINEKNKED